MQPNDHAALAGPPPAATTARRPFEPAGVPGGLRLLLVAALLASAFAAIKVAVECFSPLAVAAMRTAGGAVVVAAWVRLSSGSGRHPPAPGQWPASVFVGLVGYAVPFWLVAWAEQRLDSGLAGLLMASGPLIAASLAPLVARDERLTRSRLCGLVIGLGGVALALEPQMGQAGDAVRGLAVIAAAIGYAVAGFAARRVWLPADVLTARSLAVAALALAPAALLAGQPVAATAQARHLLAIGYLALVPTALCYVLRFRLIHRHGYLFVSFTGYLVPPFALLWGAAALSEGIGFVPLVALGLIIVGLAISQRRAGGARR